MNTTMQAPRRVCLNAAAVRTSPAATANRPAVKRVCERVESPVRRWTRSIGSVGIRAEPARGLPQDQVASGVLPAFVLGQRIGLKEGVAFGVQVALGALDERQHVAQGAVGFVQLADEPHVPVHGKPGHLARLASARFRSSPFLIN